jgi:hypothetical protein
MLLVSVTTSMFEKPVMAVEEDVEPFNVAFPVNEMAPLMYRGAAARPWLKMIPANVTIAAQTTEVGVVFILVGVPRPSTEYLPGRPSVDCSRLGGEIVRSIDTEPLRGRGLRGQAYARQQFEQQHQPTPEPPSMRPWMARGWPLSRHRS